MGKYAHLTYAPLVGVNKVGKLPVDENGYYTVVLGAMNTNNSAGAFYPYAGTEDVWGESGILRRRILNRNFCGEYGHPYKLPGESVKEFATRSMKVTEDKISHQILEVWLDMDARDKNGKPIILIMGKIKPTGPYGHILKAQLDNPLENVCFSIRAMTDDKVIRGILTKVIRIPLTWDYVREPGIEYATKLNNPTLESIDDGAVLTEDILLSIASEAKLTSNEEMSLAMEEILNSFGWTMEEKKSKRPASASWK